MSTRILEAEFEEPIVVEGACERRCRVELLELKESPLLRALRWLFVLKGVPGRDPIPRISLLVDGIIQRLGVLSTDSAPVRSYKIKNIRKKKRKRKLY